MILKQTADCVVTVYYKVYGVATQAEAEEITRHEVEKSVLVKKPSDVDINVETVSVHTKTPITSEGEKEDSESPIYKTGVRIQISGQGTIVPDGSWVFDSLPSNKHPNLHEDADKAKIGLAEHSKTVLVSTAS
jgi:hypothetical protein